MSASEAARRSVVPATQSDRANLFTAWVAFCADLGHGPFLHDVPSTLHLDFFIVYACRYRRGVLSRSTLPVRSQRVEEALRAVGQEFARLGLQDPRLDGPRYVFRLRTLYKAWADDDPAPTRVWPVNITILRALAALLRTHPNRSRSEAITDLATIGFYFLCRPGEYALSPATDRGRSKPFRLRDTTFSNPAIQRAPAAECSSHDVQRGTYVSLTYTDQKNATRGEALGHGRSGDDALCPVRAAQRRVLHLRQHNVPPECPLYRYFDASGIPHDITTGTITTELRAAAASVQHLTNIPPNRVAAYSLRSGGATALLVSGVDETAIRALGRWKSDAIFLYLRTQASTLTANYASPMLHHGQYSFSPATATYDDKDLLPLQAPAYLAAALFAVDQQPPAPGATCPAPGATCPNVP